MYLLSPHLIPQIYNRFCMLNAMPGLVFAILYDRILCPVIDIKTKIEVSSMVHTASIPNSSIWGGNVLKKKKAGPYPTFLPSLSKHLGTSGTQLISLNTKGWDEHLSQTSWAFFFFS